MAEYDVGNVEAVGSLNVGFSIIQNEMKSLQTYNNMFYVLNEKLLKLTDLLNQSDNEYHTSIENIQQQLDLDSDSQFNKRMEYYNKYKEIYIDSKKLKKEVVKINRNQPKIAEATIIEFKRLSNNLQKNKQIFGYLFGNENNKIGSFLVITEQLDLNDQGITTNQKIKKIINDNNLTTLYGIIIMNGKITQQEVEQLMKINSQDVQDGIYLIKIQKFEQDVFEIWKDGKGQIIDNQQQILLKYVKSIRFYKL